jgi:two-component system, chemotaxis family, protein-glutamate methylesterase/glutaminase
MIRVLVVDDSALMRGVLSQILSTDPAIKVVGVASDPLVAREKIKALDPDVITLDIEMPRLDGLAFLERVMRLRPMPVVMISALTQKGAVATLQALEMGAVDFIAKSTLDAERGLAVFKDEVIGKVKAAAKASIPTARRPSLPPVLAPGSVSRPPASNKIVAIGASTGGVVALKDVLAVLPTDGPPILIVQHMPPGFTRTFAARLDSLCAMRVAEAADEARVLPGHVYIAPGGQHLTLSRGDGQYRCRLSDGPPVNGHIPSVDVLFDSIAGAAGANAVGVLLTGMGKDGAQGLQRMREAGGATACQDEASCLIYGMPKAAKALGAAEHELPLDRIAAYILQQTCVAAREDRAAVRSGSNTFSG